MDGAGAWSCGLLNRRNISLLTMMVVAGLLGGCIPDPPSEPTVSPTPVTSTPNAAVTTSAGPADPPTSEASPSPASFEPTAPMTAQQPTSPAQQTMSEGTLKVGETAHLRNWDVTVIGGEHGDDGISYGWNVEVCYVAPSELEDNGRISVSDKPWSVIVQDLEGVEENPKVTIPVREFERDHSHSPDYVNTTLALGECNLGWIWIVHGNPDLGWLGMVYEPSTGERITWLS